MKHRRAFISFPQIHGISEDLLAAQKMVAGLNVSFSVTVASMDGMGGVASIDIYNLNREDMQFLTTTAAHWVEQQSIIQLYVGYDDDVRCVFSGAVMDALPQGYPDLVLHIKAESGPLWSTKILDIKKANLKIMDLVDYVSSATGYPVNIPTWVRQGNELLNKRLDSYSYTGNAWKLLDEIQEMIGGFNISEKSVFLSCYNSQITLWSPQVREGEQKLLISDETGMVGVPNPMNAGVEVTTLLNPLINIGDTIHLETKRVPIAVGDYKIKEYTHVGELRGNNFYTKIKASFPNNRLLGQSPIGG